MNTKATMNEIRWLGPYKETERFADDVTVSDMIRLRKENQELKDYLDKMERYVEYLEAQIVNLELKLKIERIMNAGISGSS